MLFLQLANVYGKVWLDMWNGLDLSDVKADWVEGINRASLNEQALHKGIEEITSGKHEFPPTLPRFIQICKAHLPRTFNRALPRRFTPEQKAKASEHYQKARRQLGWK